MLITPEKLKGTYRIRLASDSSTGQQLDAVITVEEDGWWQAQFEVRPSHKASTVTKETLGGAVYEFNEFERGRVQPLDKNV